VSLLRQTVHHALVWFQELCGAHTWAGQREGNGASSGCVISDQDILSYIRTIA
jgi:hypothetical protein